MQMSVRLNNMNRTGPTTAAKEVEKLLPQIDPKFCPKCWAAGRSLFARSCQCKPGWPHFETMNTNEGENHD